MGQITGPDVDSGYAWVIVFASFALHFQQVNTCVAVFCTYYLLFGLNGRIFVRYSKMKWAIFVDQS